jgi:subtilisin family serine protease
VFNMINVFPVWKQGYFGNGIRVRINDSGVDASHKEFAGRFDWSASCDTHVTPSDNSETHGTAVASIVAAAANNGECASGIAPQVRLSACYALSGPETFLAEKVDTMDISQNSYERPACHQQNRDLASNNNPCPFTAHHPSLTSPCSVCDDFSSPNKSDSCEYAIFMHCRYLYEDDVEACSEFLDIIIGGLCNYNILSDNARNAITKGIQQGRDGKGIIYVFASGNAYDLGDDTNFKGYTNSRYTISVAAVGQDGIHASYSTPGAGLFVSAPGGTCYKINVSRNCEIQFCEL